MRDDQEGSADIVERQIHLFLKIGKNPECLDFFDDIEHIVLSVTFGDAQQDQKTGSNPANHLAVHLN